tara:strand:+ start:281 stop:502 length:222 start_codon:yes stop_codon:yes gene_type:complete
MTKEQALENIRWALVNYLNDNPSEDGELIDKSFNKLQEDQNNFMIEGQLSSIKNHVDNVRVLVNSIEEDIEDG